jgi:hypothetical protein
MTRLPRHGERVEIFVNGRWIPATFHQSDNAVGDIDNWWRDYFVLDDHITTYPDDIQSKAELPPWRRLDG